MYYFYNFLVICLLLYPIIPTLSYIILLWHKPKKASKYDENNHDDELELKSFRKWELYSQFAAGIAGGIESPIQFTLQVESLVLMDAKLTKLNKNVLK